MPRSRVKYRIVCVQFGERMQRFFEAFERSVKTNCRDCELVVITIDKPAAVPGIDGSFTDNTAKLHVWRQEVEKSRVPVVCIDGDTVVLKDLYAAFSEFDGEVAVTERPHPCWLNGGVVFLRATKGAKEFMRLWCRVNDDLMANPRALRLALERHYGMNQTALVHAMAMTEMPCKVDKLPCQRWNNCDQTWATLDDETAVLHVKSALREHFTRYADLHSWPDWLLAARAAFLAYDPEAELMAL